MLSGASGESPASAETRKVEVGGAVYIVRRERDGDGARYSAWERYRAIDPASPESWAGHARSGIDASGRELARLIWREPPLFAKRAYGARGRWRAAVRAEAYAAIVAVFPEARGGRRDHGDIIT